MSSRPAPYPPLELVHRVFDLSNTEDPLGQYERMGRDTHEQILHLLPRDWSFEGKRVLDFGCGAGRVLRHFLAEASEAELWGTDIDRASVAWLEQHLSPPLQVVLAGERPPLPFGDGHFDLIWAVSVFSHLTDLWAEWLLELHRILDDGGILIATLVDRRGAEMLADVQWDEERIGMNRLKHANPWDCGGPVVLHSEWWLRAHWGRAFEIEGIHRPQRPATHGDWVVLRKRQVSLDAEALRAPEAGEERELLAAQHNVEQVERELERALVAAESRAESYESSWSWRLTRPLRGIAGRLSRRRHTG
jgi:SAM-dependent methyltransferase